MLYGILALIGIIYCAYLVKHDKISDFDIYTGDHTDYSDI